jgi:actin-related protein
MASNIASSVRSALRQATQPSSPHTPNRVVSSNLSSPGATYRQEEDAVIIELGSRYLRAGFEGECSPQCVLSFGPEDSRRVGDFRGWAPGGRKKDLNIEQWGQEHELWRMDLSDVDLGLVEDKIERAVREAYNKHLLTDVGSARLLLVVPSILPHPLLSTVIGTLFNRWKYSSITLLPSPTMAALGAGVRSALVVDIGWSETIATGIYEYREIATRRSIRSMQSLLKELGRSLVTQQDSKKEDKLGIDFELAEELMARMVWCKSQVANTAGRGVPAAGTEAEHDSLSSHDVENQEVEIDWPTDSSSELVKLPFTLFSKPVEKVLFTPSTAGQPLDDHEQSLPLLVYETLRALRPDVRGMCMSRIVFVGGGSSIPGLAQRVIAEVDVLAKRHGWSAFRRENDEKRRREKLKEIGQGRAVEPDARHREPLPAGADYAEEQLRKQQAKEALPVVQGELRQIESLGAWAGASLLASVKVKGAVEVDRERFLHHGLAGASRHADVSVVPQRSSYSAGLSKASGDRASWTLAGWA